MIVLFVDEDGVACAMREMPEDWRPKPVVRARNYGDDGTIYEDLYELIAIDDDDIALYSVL